MLRPALTGALKRPVDPAPRSRGQSIVELVLILPVLLLLALVAIDFGRIYLGYVNLQQMARVAAGYAAEHASAWNPVTLDQGIEDRYRELVTNDASAINCDLLEIPDPGFAGYDLGDLLHVKLTCSFDVITPVISSIVGGSVLLGADVVYPVREGAVAEVPGGGGPITIAPVAEFLGTPQSDYEPLVVTFTDLSENLPTSWVWDFGNGTNADGDGPHTVTYECPDTVPAGGSCTFDVSLTVGSTGGFDTETKAGYITAFVPPDTGPIAAFDGGPELAGYAPLTVTFTFDDIRAGSPTPVTYSMFEWDFEWDMVDDDTFDRAGATETAPSHEYTEEGVYAVRLRVTEALTGEEHQLVKLAYVAVTRHICVVPDFAGKRRNEAQDWWEAAEFTTEVQFQDGQGNYTINYQSLLGGLSDPQPDGCDSVITVGP